jgi:hypothetical protein
MNASYRGHTRALEEIEKEKTERAAQLCAEFAEKRMERAMKIAEKRGLNVTEMAIAIPGNPGEATKRVFVSGESRKHVHCQKHFCSAARIRRWVYGGSGR